MYNFLDHVNFGQLEARFLVGHKLAAAPSSPVLGQQYFDTTLNKVGVFNGASWDYAGSGGVTSVAGTLPIVSSGGNAPTLSINAASGSTPGSFASADFTKLSNATASNTASTVVMRDSSGNVAFGTVTATLTGTSSNSSNLNGQLPSFYTARVNHTGTQTSATISDFDAQVRISRLDQLAIPTSNVSLNGVKLVSLADPTNAQDGVTKNYADSLIATGNNKGTARVVATTNITLATPGATIDSVTLSSATPDIVLLAGQTVPSQNGLYVFNGAAVPLTRTTNANLSGEIRPGLFVYVAEGTNNNSNGYTLTTPAPIVLETTALTFTQTSGAGQIIPGTAITKVGNVINAVGGVGLVTNSSNLSIDTSIVARKYSQTIGDGSTLVITVTHNLNNATPTFSVSQVATPFNAVMPTVSFPTVNTVAFGFAVAPTANQYRVTIVG